MICFITSSTVSPPKIEKGALSSAADGFKLRDGAEENDPFHYVVDCVASEDRKRCPLVCRRWLQVEGRSRHRLSLNTQSDLLL
ncbi:hypothetical protein U1Q18_020319, partial [Sarracenia purpurea var. burkii]